MKSNAVVRERAACQSNEEYMVFMFVHLEQTMAKTILGFTLSFFIQLQFLIAWAGRSFLESGQTKPGPDF